MRGLPDGWDSSGGGGDVESLGYLLYLFWPFSSARSLVWVSSFSVPKVFFLALLCDEYQRSSWVLKSSKRSVSYPGGRYVDVDQCCD